ncbi:E6 [Erethizon dorsatum papillomavirus 1]|uniref:Protein E6 n=1 Tax=Erethizon dorsatum papillomavirus 1 TaxID=291590 RepID=Q5IRF6_9PAPI|nr:E6 [Erethizon dorsatum papillomavirus 1]AAU11493.1 E6 [Erethizon dorsatum papillomavirus 1]UUA80627.1 E6 [Erethizon dorsatum papillomavirus 1]WCD67580.1 E6 protein [Erethizon dorsatum papillomavirus 1]
MAKASQQKKAVCMAQERDHGTPLLPRTLRELCVWRGQEFPNVSVTCKYCKKCLSLLDVYLFDQTVLNVLWSDGTPAAVCTLCLRLLARLEFRARHMFSCTVQHIPLLLYRPFVTCTVRCVRCLMPLTTVEKEFLARQHTVVHFVGRSLRTLCTHCTAGLF